MPITYPLALPQAYAEAVTFGGRAAVAVTPSPYTFREEVQVNPGQAWMAHVKLPQLDEAAARTWIAFLLSLNGRQGTFLMGDPIRVSPRGVGTGTPLVNGANQSGQTLATDGWTASTANILRAGDLFQLGAGATATLHLVLADAASNGSGQVTLDIWPRLRTAPNDNAALTLANPLGRWRMASNEMMWDVRVAMQYGIEFDCVEALP
jgi:hypothetical protein